MLQHTWQQNWLPPRNDISLVMKRLAAHDPRIFFNASEAAANPPQLVVTVGTEQIGEGTASCGKNC